MKILLTAQKGVGKSTVVQKFIDLYKGNKTGFVISRMKDREFENQGYFAKTFDGRMEILSHKKLIKSDLIVGDNNNIDIDVVDNFLVPEIKKGLRNNDLIIIDEIGRMQSFSSDFLATVREAINSSNNILATIVFDNEPWSMEFKKHPDVLIIEVTLENRNDLPSKLMKLFNFN
jgi:nucleoside-triphosphatase THEP1